MKTSVLRLVLLVLVFTIFINSILNGASYTSTQNGTWSSATTWGGTGIPGDGDNVIIEHNITITLNKIIGTGSGTAITINNSGTLTLNSNFTLTCKGNIIASGTITLEAGSNLEMDTPSPSLIQLTSGNTFAHLQINGTETQHCSVRAIGRGHTRITDNDEYGGGRVDANYCDFQKLGDNPDYRTIQFIPTSTGEPFRFEYCTFDQCSRIKVNDYENLDIPSGAYIEFNKCKWTNSIKDPNADPDGVWEIFETWSNNGVTFKILNCDFDQKVALMRPRNLEIEDCVFRKGLVAYSGEYMGGNIKSFKNNFVRWYNIDEAATEIAYGSTIEDCVFIIDNQGWNPHYIAISGGGGVTNIIGNIWWYTGVHPDAEGDGVIINSPDSLTASENVITIEKNIYLPNSNGYDGVHSLSCTGFSINWEEKERQIIFKRNTLYTGHWGGGINIGETQPTSTGNIAYVKSNLFIGDINSEGSKISNMDYVETDAFLAENVDYNAGFRIPEGEAFGNGSGKGYDIFPFSGSNIVGANDIDDVDPQFIDHDRTPASWSGSLEATMDRLSPEGGYQITELLNYIREGFRPQNNLLNNAGDPDDGSPDIGAVDLGSPVPVELETFNAKLSGKVVELNWQTATEVNNYGFLVERLPKSSNTNVWETIGFVEGHGNSNSPKNYSFTDHTISKTGKYSYRLKQTDIDGKFEYSSIIEMTVSIQIKFALFQNYPNPFNPTTNISFTLPNDSNLRLTIINVLGQEIKELINGNKKAGFHNYTFDASSLSNGIYYYRIESELFTETKSMILIK